MNKNYVGTYGVIKKNGGIDLICSVNYEGGGLFASILKCIDENDEYLKVIIFIHSILVFLIFVIFFSLSRFYSFIFSNLFSSS